jgi:hypothetical protein
MDTLQSLWQSSEAPQKPTAAIQSMMHEKTHPVLKRIRRQMIFEAIAFTIFLIVYYDFFDGHRRPVFTNILLVAGLLLVIIHNIIGYVLTKSLPMRNTIKQTLEAHVTKIKNFAFVSVLSRILAAACLLLFFTFATTKYWLLAAIIIILIIQIALLSAIWIKRIKQLNDVLSGLD